MLLMIAIILGFGAIRIATGAITAGALIAMIFYVMQLSMPLMNLSTLVTDYKKAVGASQRIYEIMQEPVEPMEQLKPINIGIAMKVSKVICQSIINSIIIEPINVIIAGSNCGNF